MESKETESAAVNAELKVLNLFESHYIQRDNKSKYSGSNVWILKNRETREYRCRIRQLDKSCLGKQRY